MACTDLVKQNKVYHYKVPIYLISTRYLSALHILTQLYQNKFLKYILKCCLIYRFQRGRGLPSIAHKSTSLFYVRIINASIVCITALKFLFGKKKITYSPKHLVLTAAPPFVPIFSSAISPHSHSTHLYDNERNTPLLNLLKDCSF